VELSWSEVENGGKITFLGQLVPNCLIESEFQNLSLD
jgi:hypothetical protein